MDSGSKENNRKISGDKDTIDSLKNNKVDNGTGDSVNGISSRKVSESNEDTIGSLKSKKGIATGTGNVPKKIDSISGISKKVLSVSKDIIDGLKNQNKDLTKDTGSVTKKIDIVNCKVVSDSKDTIDIDSLKNKKVTVLDKIDSEKEYSKPSGDCNVFNVIPSEGGKTKIGNVGSTTKQNKPYLKCLKTSGSDCIGKTKEAKMRMNIMKLFLDRKKNKKSSLPISKVKDATIVKKTDDSNQIKCKIKSDAKIKIKTDCKSKNKGRSILKQNVVEEPKESKRELKLKDDLSEFLVVKKFSEKTTENKDTDINTKNKIVSCNTHSLLKTSLVSLLTKEATFPTNNLQLYIPLKPVTKEKPKITVDEVQKKIKTVSIGSLYETLVRDTVTDDNDNYCTNSNESITPANFVNPNNSPDLYNPKSTDLLGIGPENNTKAEKRERKRKYSDSDQDIASPNKIKKKLIDLATENSSDKIINNNNTDLKLNKSKKKEINLDDGSKIRFEYIPNPDLNTIDLTETSENMKAIPTDDDSRINPDLPVLVL